MFKLKITKGPDRVGEKLTLKTNSQLVIGRSDSADFKLTKGSVSKKHCVIRVLSDSELEIEDLGSSNGTFVNGVLIKKHICVAGDIIKISQYELSLSDSSSQKAILTPKLVTETPDFGSSRPASSTRLTKLGASPSESWNSSPESGAEPKDFGAKVLNWLESNVYPLADKLSSTISVRLLLTVSFVFWSILLITLTAYPFMDKANQRVQTQAVEVARLYARQLVRVNQSAIVEQRYNQLVGVLDAKSGQTPGLVESLILDNQKAQILAPSDKLGLGLPNNFASRAIASEKEFIAIDSDGRAHVGLPIFIGTVDGNKAVATAYVVFNIDRAIFNAATLLDQITTSLLVGLILGGILLLFAYRWTEGSLVRLTSQINTHSRDPSQEIKLEVNWKPISELSAEINSLAIKAQNGANPQGNFNSADAGASSQALSEWVNSVPFASALMDSNQIITAWNSKMEQISGIRSLQAVGSDISGASRDLSFETTIKELCDAALNNSNSVHKKELDISGTNYVVNVTFVSSQFLITIAQEGT